MPRTHAPKPRLTPNAVTVLQRRYLARHAEGRTRETPAQMFQRVADNVAHAETLYPGSRRTIRIEPGNFMR